jgi:hypothetical protein
MPDLAASTGRERAAKMAEEMQAFSAAFLSGEGRPAFDGFLSRAKA